MSRASLGQGVFSGDIGAMIEERSKLVPLGRMATVWDIANAAVYFASDEGNYVSGVLLPVDGGAST